MSDIQTNENMTSVKIDDSTVLGVSHRNVNENESNVTKVNIRSDKKLTSNSESNVKINIIIYFFLN